jgi:beta-N-acetylhexosaminidase
MHLGAHFYIGIPKPTLSSTTIGLLKEIRPGGIILFGRNVHSPEQLSKLTQSLRKLLGPQLLICIDHEGGRVNRLKDLIGIVPSAMQLGYLGEKKFAYQHGQLTGRLLSELGINYNLAPVLDLWLKPKTDNSVPDRCWAKKPTDVARLAGAFLEGMQEEGVAGCGKHFLSYGAADKDPHLVIPMVTRTRSQILKEDLRPYKLLSLPKSIAQPRPRHLQSIMLSHAHLKAFHGEHLTPACVSPLISFDLLRTQMGFQGITITDDLEMGAITKTITVGKASAECLKIGTDLILICHTAPAMREGFMEAQKAEREGLFATSIREESAQRLEKFRTRVRNRTSFSKKRWDTLCKDIRQFKKTIFSLLPYKLKIIDERWGPIGEKY